MKHSELDPNDLGWVLRKLPRPVKELMTKYGDRIVLGGGFIRSCVQGERPNDIDLFVKSVDDAKVFAEELAGTKKVRETDNTFYVNRVQGYCVQFIHRWVFESPAKILDSFDFTVACAAVWFNHGYYGDVTFPCNQWASLTDERYYRDLAAKRLVYRSPVRNEDAGGSALRCLKYQTKGFRITLDSYGAVLARLMMTVDEEKIQAVFVENRALSREQAYAKVLTALLVEVDPLADPTHAAHLPRLKDV